MRKKLTTENMKFLSELIDAYSAQLQHEFNSQIRDEMRDAINAFNNIKTTFNKFQQLGQILDSPEVSILENDETTYVNVEGGWQKLALEEMARSFGRFGVDAISSLSELLLYTNTLSKAFGSKNLYYRGENKFGYQLCSRAERYLEEGEGTQPGLTERELYELRRFQEEVLSNEVDILEDIRELPDLDSPLWLPIMQHYDDKFGTRLLDITSSPFAALYFACVSWDGEIDENTDGLIYSFMVGGNMPIRGRYYDVMPDSYDDEMDELPVKNIQKCFIDWTCPEVLRLYQSSFASPRELAQDGSFLVKGALIDKYGFGQGFKFRIPGEIKKEITRELWLAGYTPRRMVRGIKGKLAEEKLRNLLGLVSF